ncbi:MAG: terminase family protein [Parvularcula sp.]|nr:terminase family protein [Parvularcula sp.]
MLDNPFDTFLRSVSEDLDPSPLFERVIGPPDPWQRDFLQSAAVFLLCLCSRQVGKSTSTAALAWAALSRGEFVLVVAPSERQSRELFKKVLFFRHHSGTGIKSVRSTLTELELENGGRLICVPASSDSIRGFTVDRGLIIFEEAAFIADDVFSAVIPMRGVNGRIIMITTPAGPSGAFHDYWTKGSAARIFARSLDQPRLVEKVAFDREHMPPAKFRQEHEALFLGAGTPFFDHETIRRAYVDVPPLDLGDLHADRLRRETRSADL